MHRYFASGRLGRAGVLFAQRPRQHEVLYCLWSGLERKVISVDDIGARPGDIVVVSPDDMEFYEHTVGDLETLDGYFVLQLPGGYSKVI